jgi:hypothetical protein
LTEEDLEKITKEWSADLLVPTDLAEISDVESPEAILDTPRPSKTKKMMKFKISIAHPRRLLRSHLRREVMVKN